MKSLIDNAHLLQKKYDLSSNSFILNVNTLVDNLDEIIDINDKFSADEIETINDFIESNGGEFDISEISTDIKKGTFRGKRKIDIDVFKNFKSYTDELTTTEKIELGSKAKNRVYYKGVKFIFSDGTYSTHTFTTPRWSNAEILTEISSLINSATATVNAAVTAATTAGTSYTRPRKLDSIVALDVGASGLSTNSDYHICRLIDRVSLTDSTSTAGSKLDSVTLIMLDEDDDTYTVYASDFVGARTEKTTNLDSVDNSDGTTTVNYNNINFAWSDTTSSIAIIVNNMDSILTASTISDRVAGYVLEIETKQNTATTAIDIAKTTALTAIATEFNSSKNTVNTLISNGISSFNSTYNTAMSNIDTKMSSISDTFSKESDTNPGYMQRLETLGDNQITRINAAIGSVTSSLVQNSLQSFYKVFDSAVAANTNISLTYGDLTVSYYIGKKQLIVFYNGAVILPTSYTEVGTVGDSGYTLSSIIQLKFAVSAGDQLFGVVIPFGTTDVSSQITSLNSRVTALEGGNS